MTKDALKQLIQEVVKEEVKSALPEILPQIMAEIFTAKTLPVSSRTSITQPVKQQAPVAPTVKKEYKVYTKHEVLNKVLNETVGGVPQEGSLVSSGMGGSTVSVMDHIDKVPEPIANALTKNYSSLLKAVDKKRSGGISNTGSVGMM